jgi:hypothetical protein
MMHFPNVKALSRWLLQTNQGMEVLDSLASYFLETSAAGEQAICEECDRRLAGRTSVLVVLNADGGVEVYAGRDVKVHGVTRICVPPQLEAKADEYTDLMIAPRFRKLYYPVNLRWVGRCEHVTVEQEAWRRWEREWLDAIRSLKP